MLRFTRLYKLIRLSLFVFFILPCGELSFASPWVDPHQESLISYVYVPGVMGSEILMGRYCPFFIGSTGEEVTCTKGIEVLRLPVVGGNLAEIKLRPLPSHRAARKIAGRRERSRKIRKKDICHKNIDQIQRGHQHTRDKKESTLFFIVTAPLRGLMHCFTALRHKMFGLTVKRDDYGERSDARLDKKVCLDCYERKSLKAHSILPAKINMAQKDDLEMLENLYNAHKESVKKTFPGHRDYGVVLYGHSRGAAAIFNFAALRNDPAIKAIVCEGVFDSIEHVAQATKSFRVRLMAKLLSTITKFDKCGILPIKSVANIPLDLPILLITSQGDEVVPPACTIALYSALCERGHQKVHILVLRKSGHVGYPQNNKEDRELYENVVHAFYRYYGLPYRLACADAGQHYFVNYTQPDYF